MLTANIVQRAFNPIVIKSMFTTDDIWRIIGFLGLATDTVQVTALQVRLAEIEAVSVFLATQIQNDLRLLQELDTSLQKYLGVTRADIIEFDAKQRGMGLITRSIQIIRRLAKVLGIEPDLSGLQEMYASIAGNENDQPLTIGKVRA
jgi:hypothetical protein